MATAQTATTPADVCFFLLSLTGAVAVACLADAARILL